MQIAGGGKSLTGLIAAGHLVLGLAVEEGDEKGSNYDGHAKDCHVLSI